MIIPLFFITLVMRKLNVSKRMYIESIKNVDMVNKRDQSEVEKLRELCDDLEISLMNCNETLDLSQRSTSANISLNLNRLNKTLLFGPSGRVSITIVRRNFKMN